MTEIVPRDVRGRIAALDYEGVASVEDARTLRQQMAAAVEAAKRAGVSEVEWMLNAREAERALGRMILAARQAGDLAESGSPDLELLAQPTLQDLKIPRELAADAVMLAKVPDDLWTERVRAVAEKREATYRAVVSWARTYAAQVEAAAAAHEARLDELARREAELKRVQADAKRRLEELRRQREEEQRRVNAVAVPPLRPAETSMAGAEMALRATFPTEAEPTVAPTKDSRPEVVEQEALVKTMNALARRIAAHNPTVRTDPYRDVDLYGARDAARRLVDAATVWIRTYNALAESESSDVR